ncbi:hypothetical protein [Actinoplanes sp. NPDC049265]|uniref:hypothetical protein n=1 Tax=Actinoplanes sp. NPDC049265 TaxID=3363902 RepID=UPI0037165493
MSPYRIAADTELINNPTLRHAAEQIRKAIETYDRDVAGVGQVVLHDRESDVDEYVVDLIRQAPEVTRNLLAMIERAANGDVGAARDMADFFAKAEEEHVVQASTGTITTH